MQVTLTIKRGDTGIGVQATLSNLRGCIDLTDSTVLFIFKGENVPVDIVDAENGIVNVYFNRIHTEKSGFYNAEFEVQFPDGRIETYPSDGYLKIRIYDDLGGIS